MSEFARKLQSEDAFVLLDVRELTELESARIQDSRLQVTPMSLLAARGLAGLPEAAQDKGAELLILCHHGARSGQVAGWLTAKGWTRAFSVSGGIDEYARRVDSSVGSY
ncbi:MAG TPA: rhodanese-like domain-containing protein [Anaerolineales bacterium]|nr:rhodanese-like domain-containing protein [Anaerolineales bacterium]